MATKSRDHHNMDIEEVIFLIRGAALIVAFALVVYIFFVEKAQYVVGG